MAFSYRAVYYFIPILYFLESLDAPQERTPQPGWVLRRKSQQRDCRLHCAPATHPQTGRERETEQIERERGREQQRRRCPSVKLRPAILPRSHSKTLRRTEHQAPLEAEEKEETFGRAERLAGKAGRGCTAYFVLYFRYNTQRRPLSTSGKHKDRSSNLLPGSSSMMYLAALQK